MEIIKNEGVWRLFDNQASLILTDEKQLLRIIQDPALPLFDDEERGHSGEHHGIYDRNVSLVNICEDAQEQNAKRLEVSYDFFFGGTTRTNYPDSEITIKAFKIIRDIAKKYGMSFGASIINPLDIGGGYALNHDNTGLTYNYLETEIESDGSFSASMVYQHQWYNNKGPITLKLHHVEVYAFNELKLENTSYFYVDPDGIKDITDCANYEVDEQSIKITGAGYGYGNMRIFGKTSCDSCTRCLCIAVYKTPEMDYFSADTLTYMKGVIDKHSEAGIDYQGFYSDEMHIQFDWDLGQHFGETEINTRYLTQSFIKEYSKRYGSKFKNFTKYLIYFSYHQHDFLNDKEGKEPSQHVWGMDDMSIYETWLFRKRYFEMLQNKVVDLSCKIKDYAESLFGSPIMTRAHATWQESPTCDHIDKNGSGIEISKYEYTPSYDWSSSIRENMSACYDYFKWNDYLSGAGSDHAEGGNSDRCYYSEALASSFGALNKFDLAYSATWGSPDEITHRFYNVGSTYGNPSLSPRNYNLVQDMKHRKSDVIALYPLDLNYVEERFGSWMTQYGYCNYITEDKFLQNANVTKKGKIIINGFEYKSVLILFSPLISEKTLDLIEAFLNNGGKVIWSSIYPKLSQCDSDIFYKWRKLFGIKRMYTHAWNGMSASGKQVEFLGSFKEIPNMPIITNLLPDKTYIIDPVEKNEKNNIEVIACIENEVVGVIKHYENNGCAAYLGFRPRDDQSKSLGYDISTLFDVLCKMGAYSENSLELQSRPEKSKYIMNSFGNGAVSIANHYRTFGEAWDGAFFRNQDIDKEYLKNRELPPIDITLENESILGHKITYSGIDTLTYNIDTNGKLSGFCGVGGTEIIIDSVKYPLCTQPMTLSFAKVSNRFLADGINECYIISATVVDHLTLPLQFTSYTDLKAKLCCDSLFCAEVDIPFTVENNIVNLDITDNFINKFITIYR